MLSIENQEKLQSFAKAMTEDENPPMEDYPEEWNDPEESGTVSGRTFSVSVVSAVAYLIGVPEEHFSTIYKKSIYEDLEKNERAHIIRSLSSIRKTLIQYPGDIYSELWYQMKPLDQMPEYIDPNHFRYLSEHGITILRGARPKEITEYIVSINDYISNRINGCRDLFPSWVKWEYIKECFVMPKGTKVSGAQSAIDIGKEYRNFPFQCYINWPCGDPSAFQENYQSFSDPKPTGNILLNDKKFLVLLYRIHSDEFVDLERVYDASKKQKDSFTDYMQKNDHVTILVDCENSDPYKLCAMLEFLLEERVRSEQAGEEDQPAYGSIDKIILFDDYHTIDAWDILHKYTKIEIDHREVERVLNHKSLIDIAMCVGACEEYFVKGVKSFIVASSDSDYWGLMRALPDAKFMVLAEKNKFSQDTLHFYEEHDIPTCMIDEFAGNLSKIKEGALRYSLEKHMNNLITVNLYETLDNMYGELRMDATDQERDNNRKLLARKLRIAIEDQGDIRFYFDA